MKKTFFVVFTTLILGSIAIAGKIYLLKKPQPLYMHETLNGVDYNTKAKSMIATFKGAYSLDRNRLRSISEWYSRKDIEDMLDLLKGEADRVDGIRFYFGAQSVNGNQIATRLFLVTTKLRIPVPTDPKISAHQDYYEHDSKYAILSRETGADLYDNSTEELKEGGLLYGDKKPDFTGTNCTLQDPHMLDGDKAYDWVQKRHDTPYAGSLPAPVRDPSNYNTESEWFDICFISSLFSKIVNDNQFTGLRVYSGKGFSSKDRDVFILVPTYANGRLNQDYYKCLNLTYASPCNVPLRDSITGKKFTKIELQNKFNIKYLKSGNYMTGAYDNGELCPDVCN